VQEFDGEVYHEWVEFARAGDVLVVDRLELIPPFRSKRCPSPVAVLGEVRGLIRAKGLTLIESLTGKEPTPERWREATKNLARGARSSLKQAKLREGGELRAEQLIRESVESYWKTHKDRAKFQAIWLSRKHANAEEAAEAVNVEAERLNYQRPGSVRACYRAFGDRRIQKNHHEDRDGFVYFARARSIKRVKIGYSTNIKQRMLTLRHPLLGNMKVLAWMHGTEKTESEMHKRFMDLHIAGEWFRLEGKLAKLIDELAIENRAEMKLRKT
jgi:hypothetical protein